MLTKQVSHTADYAAEGADPARPSGWVARDPLSMCR